MAVTLNGVHVGQQFQQLDMLRPARDLVDAAKIKHLDSSHYRDHDDMWEQKLEEADDQGLGASIEREGIRKPVPLAHNPEFYPREVLSDGHHRVAVANDLHPDYLVPVEHFDSHRDYWRSQGRVMGDIGRTGEFYYSSHYSGSGSDLS